MIIGRQLEESRAIKKMLRKDRSESFALNPQLSTCDTDSFVEIIIC